MARVQPWVSLMQQLPCGLQPEFSSWECYCPVLAVPYKCTSEGNGVESSRYCKYDVMSGVMSKVAVFSDGVVLGLCTGQLCKWTPHME